MTQFVGDVRGQLIRSSTKTKTSQYPTMCLEDGGRALRLVYVLCPHFSWNRPENDANGMSPLTWIYTWNHILVLMRNE